MATPALGGTAGEEPITSAESLEATDLERRVLVEELLESVAFFPDHLEVTVQGAPRLNVTLEEAGLGPGGWQFCGVGGGI